MSTLIPTRPSRLGAWLGRDPFASLREEFDDVLTRFAGDGGWMTEAVRPAMDLAESDGQFELSLDLPGVKPADVDVEISGNTVRITGQYSEEKEEKGKTIHRTERRRGSFARSLTLPCGINEAKVTAEYKDGVLHVTLPKSDAAKSHHIEIRS